jgi:hypothetical protein
MILGMEIALSVMGIYMLCTGKTWGKNPVKHWQFRLLGGFLLTMFPAALVAVGVMAVVYGATHAGLSPDVMKDNLRWPLIGVEAGTVIIYGVIAVLWEKRIRSIASRVPTMSAAPAIEPIPPAPAAPDHPMIPPNKTFGQS